MIAASAGALFPRASIPTSTLNQKWVDAVAPFNHRAESSTGAGTLQARIWLIGLIGATLSERESAKVETPKASISIGLDPSWPATRIAAAILDAMREQYPQLDIDGLQKSMDEIWRDLRDLFTEEELNRLDQISHIAIPTGDLSASISVSRSRQGHFILFDALLDLRLSEIFTAPRNPAAWAACYTRAAFDRSFSIADWVTPAVDKLQNIRGGPYPDSFSLMAARHFVYAHEWGHFFLGHLDTGKYSKKQFGDAAMLVFDPALKDEVDADHFARNLLCGRLPQFTGHSLHMQQMGVDWLFGFLGCVLAMRRRAAETRKGRPDWPITHAAMTKRRALAWADYQRRCNESANDGDRGADNALTVQRVRDSVDNFNNELPAALADMYAAVPEELMDWQSRVAHSPPPDDDGKLQLAELATIGEKAIARTPPVSRRHRLSLWLNKIF